MAYSEQLMQRIRNALAHLSHVQEQQKMGGVSFMVNGKMLVRAHSDASMMLRCAPEMTDELLQKTGARRFEMKGKPMMKGWLLIMPEGMRSQRDFDSWIKLALDFHKTAER